ncbi:Insulin-like growth factor-binding protein complex acid labile subunit [Frankliniella fusca]|uniref:Insulin-like growth factor-binding protein complex acid labile subunit n=1 Tax=Frankliniella fusca TaxID=407009 RepID=A0AAE1I693_9NEOP|nr:Insulin-like growth factor-binding protein complex acid labile subunit [Frankliniella fusca]
MEFLFCKKQHFEFLQIDTPASLGLYDALPDHVVCEHCEKTHRKREVKYFVTFSLRKQLEKFLNLPGTSEILNYSNIRVKNSDDCYEDIYDGHKYCELREEGGPLHSPYSFSYNINTDGVSLSESSQTEAWPLYIRLNECKPTLRQKCVFIAALWVDKKKPNFNLFLKNFVDEGNGLLENGIQWTPPGAVEEVTSIFCPACLVVDAKARAPCLNMKDVTGHYGCTFCTHVGVSRGRGPVKFPVRPNPPEYDFEEPVLRSDDSIRNGMMTAQPVRDGDVLGVKGPSQLMRLLNFDLFVNQVTDDLHPWFEGVAKFHTELMLQRRKPWSIPSDELPTVNRRIHLSVTPTTLSRKPRDLSVSNQWTGTEWRNWLINYSIPCLQGTIPRRYLQHWSLLANAAYLLHKSSISEEDLNTAERCIRSYSETFEDYFGVDNMRYNLHVLIHSVISVRNWGPMWAHSTFPFESMNSKVLNSIFSPKDPINQVLLRLQMVSLVNTIPLAGNISEEVRQLVGSLSDKTRKIVTTVNGAHFLGSGTRRLPTNAELELLRRRNIECDHITEYYRVLHNGIEFRSPL